MRPWLPAPRAFVEGGRPTGNGECAQHERVEHEARIMLLLRYRSQRPDDKQVEPQRRLAFLSGQPLSGLEDRRRRRVTRVVARDRPAVRRDRLGLRDDVELAAGVELAVDLAERLEPCAELGAGPANAFGHRTHPAMPAGEQRDDAVGLTELLGA